MAAVAMHWRVAGTLADLAGAPNIRATDNPCENQVVMTGTLGIFLA